MHALLLSAAALAAPAPEGKPAALSTALFHLQRTAPPGADLVQVVVVPSDKHGAAVLGDDIAYSLPRTRLERVAGGLVQVLVPVDQLDDVAALPGVRRVRQPVRAVPKGELSEGLEVMGIEDWHAAGLDGRGVRVAVLDVGFFGYEGLLGDDLPGSVETNFFGDPDITEHGTAVAEIIHDIAPRAELAFYSFETEVEFYDACQAIIDNGDYLVNASIGFDNVWHADGTSSYAGVVDQMADLGVTWVAAAGNESDRYWVGELTDDDDNGYLEMNGTELLPVYVGDGYSGASLRWDEDFGAAAMDLDLQILAEDGATLLGESQETQDGSGDPYESAEVESEDEYVYVAIVDYSGSQGTSSAGVKAWLYGDWELGEGWATYTETLTLPADAEGALAVGAVEFWTGEIASYSSRGPTNDGRTKPDVSAPTGVTTWSYGETGFDGTSAAAPHTTGLAALVLEATDLGYDPETLKDWLIDTSVDLGDPGPDNDYGHGHVVADELPPGYEPVEDDDGGDTDDDTDAGTDDDTDDDTDAGGDSGVWDSGTTPPRDDDEDEDKGGCTTAPTAMGLSGLVALLLPLLGRRRAH